MDNINFYRTEISKYTKNSVKKAYLTRARNQCVEHLTDLTWAYKRSGWLHGERVTGRDFAQVHDEMNAIDFIYEEL
tara:strand:- start:1034 stop:1261 length:228 start_codon:yes stop_codon:yes gene_type:complete